LLVPRPSNGDFNVQPKFAIRAVEGC